MAGNEWERLARYIAERMKALNWNKADLVRESSLSEPTIRGLVSGQPRVQGRPHDKTLTTLSIGLGWSPGSVAAILDGGEPELDDTLPTGSAVSRPDDALDDRLERLEQDVGILRDLVVSAIEHWTEEQRQLVAALNRRHEQEAQP